MGLASLSFAQEFGGGRVKLIVRTFCNDLGDMRKERSDLQSLGFCQFA